MKEKVDEEFDKYFNSAQPMMAIAQAKGAQETALAIKHAIQRAYVTAYATGFQEAVSREVPK